MSKMEQKAAIYVRVSTEEQASEGYSISAQTDVLTQYCNLFNLNIYKVYKDLGISGKDIKNRAALQQLLRDSKKGIFNTVLVWKISRLSRSLKDLLTLVDQFEKNGVSFVSYSEKFDTSSPAGRMTLQILGSIAEFERNTIIENVKLGLREVAKQGRKNGGAILGYDMDNKEMVINEKEAAAVQLIFELYDNKKMGLGKIAAYLNERGYQTKRGGKFSKDAIGVILSNPTYIGINRHQTNSEEDYYEVEGKHAPIISRDLWEQVQKRRKRRANITTRRHEEGTFLLTGLMKCPACGYNMISSYAMSYKNMKDGSRKTYRYRFYKCSQYDRYSTVGCTAHSMSANRIENEVMGYIYKLVQDPAIIEDALSNFDRKIKMDMEPMKAELTNLQSEMDKLQKAKERYFLMFESGKEINQRIFIDRLTSIDQQIKAYEVRKDEIEASISDCHVEPLNRKQIVRALKQFLSLMEVADVKDKSELIRSLIKEIHLTPECKILSIELHFPLHSSSTTYTF